MTQSWDHDIPGPEWGAFGDNRCEQKLFLVHHEDDKLPDQFWQMRGEMVVFGFGRQYPCCGTYMRQAPAHFTVGFAERNGYAGVIKTVDNAWRPVDVRVAGTTVLP